MALKVYFILGHERFSLKVIKFMDIHYSDFITILLCNSECVISLQLLGVNSMKYGTMTMRVFTEESLELRCWHSNLHKTEYPLNIFPIVTILIKFMEINIYEVQILYFVLLCSAGCSVHSYVQIKKLFHSNACP